MPTANINTFSARIGTGAYAGTTSRTYAERSAQILNVLEFGAKGNGSTDDAAAIQATFDAAFGPVSNPHGNANRFLNKAVYFPAGDYQISLPLYLVNVKGAHIFGDSAQTTRIAFTGAFNGNTQATATGGANTITPVIMTNGVSYSRIEALNLSIGNTASTGLYIYQDGTKGQTNANTFVDMLFDTGTIGCLIGYEANGLCSENLFLNCSALSCGSKGFQNISSNALNNCFVGCGAANNPVNFDCPTGSIQIHTASLAQAGTVDIATGQNPITIIGTRTESANFVNTTASSGVTHFISGCIQSAGGGAGSFINLGSSNKAVIMGCNQQSAAATDGLLTGTSGSVAYLLGNVFANASYKNAFTGTVVGGTSTSPVL